MPFVKIEIIKGKSKQYKQTLFSAINDCLYNALSVDPSKTNLRILEWELDNFLLTPGKSDKFILIEVNLLKGRDEVLKESFIEQLTMTLSQSLAIAPNDVHIILRDVSKTDWGHGGLPATHW